MFVVSWTVCRAVCVVSCLARVVCCVFFRCCGCVVYCFLFVVCRVLFVLCFLGYLYVVRSVLCVVCCRWSIVFVGGDLCTCVLVVCYLFCCAFCFLCSVCNVCVCCYLLVRFCDLCCL